LNRLANSGSPYLQEHADNPVDWYEWGPEALAKAKAENKPLIISVGYSSCHWCHVMEKESFMDTTVARVMNENFICIKVDREERPDIDQIYLNAAQLISGNAGWPLNAFALPDGKPFYAGTYFTRDQWLQMLGQITEAYKKENNNVLKQADALTKEIQSHEMISASPDNIQRFDQKNYRNVFDNLFAQLDPISGGIKGAPKFPMPVVWEFLLQYHHLTKDENALALVTNTLDNMARGGIYDHLGGGFSRYATDNQWRVPHFEKMLYDNAQLVSLYSHAYQVTKNPLYTEIIHKTLEFIQREMTASNGGFYSSINADSDGEEGKFYVWTKKEINDVLDIRTAELFNDYYQISDSGNWEDGKNILFAKITKKEFAQEKAMTQSECNRILAEAGQRLFLTRMNRTPPSRDDKVLVSWNALMLKGYLDAYFAMGNPDYLQTALENARFLENNLMRQDGSLMRNYKDDKASIDAFLDDYALVAKAFIYLYQATFDIHWLDKARATVMYAISHFRDDKSGLFFYTSDASEVLVARKMEIADNVIASSNSVLAEVIFLLGEYYDRDDYIRMSSSMVNHVSEEMPKAGPYYAHWASLMGMITFKPFEVAVMGEDALQKTKEIFRHYTPTSIFMGGNQENLPLLENKLVMNRTMIYVCRNKVCKIPVQDPHLAVQQLRVN
jgi:uncharacterized protein YyaL (SSP411 family)